MVLALSAAIGSLAINKTIAAEHEHQEHHEAASKIKVPDTLEGIWKEIHAHEQQLMDSVKAKKLSEVHEHAFAIRDLAKGLPAKTHPDHKKHVENLVKRISQLAEDLDKSGDAGNQAATEAYLKRMDAALKSAAEMTGEK